MNVSHHLNSAAMDSKEELRDATPDRLRNTRGQKLPPNAKNRDVTCWVKPITTDGDGLTGAGHDNLIAFKEDDDPGYDEED